MLAGTENPTSRNLHGFHLKFKNHDVWSYVLGVKLCMKSPSYVALKEIQMAIFSPEFLSLPYIQPLNWFTTLRSAFCFVFFWSWKRVILIVIRFILCQTNDAFTLELSFFRIEFVDPFQTWLCLHLYFYLMQVIFFAGCYKLVHLQGYYSDTWG